MQQQYNRNYNGPKAGDPVRGVEEPLDGFEHKELARLLFAM